MVQRLKTGSEAMVFVSKIMYTIFVLPGLLLVGGLGAFAIMVDGTRDIPPAVVMILSVTWVGLLVPILIFIFNVIKKRRQLKTLVAEIKHPLYFEPQVGYELFHEGDGKYFGIDLVHGTMLYIHRIRKGEVDVVGLDMDSWDNREVEGKMFRLYTKFPELPRIEIATPWAQRWYDTVGAMENRQYATPTRFSEFVAAHYPMLEEVNRIKIPRLA